MKGNLTLLDEMRGGRGASATGGFIEGQRENAVLFEQTGFRPGKFDTTQSL